jgi:type I protein arginine methyltransferase
VVADIGAGSGILSIFAAISGAKKVFAIEKADIVSTCRQNVQERNLE